MQVHTPIFRVICYNLGTSWTNPWPTRLSNWSHAQKVTCHLRSCDQDVCFKSLSIRDKCMTQRSGNCCLFTYVYLTESRMTDRLLMCTWYRLITYWCVPDTASYMLTIGNQLDKMVTKALYGNEILNVNSTSGFSGGHWSDRGIHHDMT